MFEMPPVPMKFAVVTNNSRIYSPPPDIRIGSGDDHGGFRVQRIGLLGFALSIAVGCGTSAEQKVEVKKAPEEKTGTKVGEKAPDFNLKDQSGDERELKALLMDGPVALVFFRSASW